MITIFSSTNRNDSHTYKISQLYSLALNDEKIENQIFSLKDIPENFLTEELYGKRSIAFNSAVEKYIAQVEKFIFIIPEYNGSFPGILKLFIDGVPPSLWAKKKAALVGVSTGRAGNLRGLDHFTGVLHYLKMEVYSNKPVYPVVDKYFAGENDLIKVDYNKKIIGQINGFVSF
jgi:chromate reductase, NAD(P)H dehydrogenase (quinone)